ncbi:hypothetical protein [uncultured Pontibacter sp.]|uniref:hypothetical protein n=1 Tax=uncultured Pontibacter sp. TaxID=453356 RepID=UPI002634C8CA|nr:hypothetical protein [uncultured Pontibacter sp.]
MVFKKESSFPELHEITPARLEKALVIKTRYKQRQTMHVERSNSELLKKTGGLTFQQQGSSVQPTASVHEKDISEMTYDEFIHRNYGQPYQRYHNTIAVKLK